MGDRGPDLFFAGGGGGGHAILKYVTETHIFLCAFCLWKTHIFVCAFRTILNHFANGTFYTPLLFSKNKDSFVWISGSSESFSSRTVQIQAEGGVQGVACVSSLIYISKNVFRSVFKSNLKHDKMCFIKKHFKIFSDWLKSYYNFKLPN